MAPDSVPIRVYNKRNHVIVRHVLQLSIRLVLSNGLHNTLLLTEYVRTLASLLQQHHRCPCLVCRTVSFLIAMRQPCTIWRAMLGDAQGIHNLTFHQILCSQPAAGLAGAVCAEGLPYAPERERRPAGDKAP